MFKRVSEAASPSSFSSPSSTSSPWVVALWMQLVNLDRSSDALANTTPMPSSSISLSLRKPLVVSKKVGCGVSKQNYWIEEAPNNNGLSYDIISICDCRHCALSPHMCMPAKPHKTTKSIFPFFLFLFLFLFLYKD